MAGPGNESGWQQSSHHQDDYLNDPNHLYSSDTQFEFRILYELESGISHSYCGYQQNINGDHNSPTFIDVLADGVATASYAGVWSGAEKPQYVFTTSEIIDKVESMVSCSYHNYPSMSFGYAGVGSDLQISSAKRFRNNLYLAIDTGSNGDGSIKQGNDRSIDTGSFSFYQITSANTKNDPLKRFKFYGNKVCNMLGLPENTWLYTDSVRIHAKSGSSHAFQGSSVMNEVAVLNEFNLSNIANVTSDIPFRIDPLVSERFLRMVDNRGSKPINQIQIGFQGDVSSSYTQNYGPDTMGDNGEEFHWRNSIGGGLPTGPAPNYKVATRGNLGGGTLDPIYPLHVSGGGAHWPTAFIDGNLAVNGAITSSLIAGRSAGSGISISPGWEQSHAGTSLGIMDMSGDVIMNFQVDGHDLFNVGKIGGKHVTVNSAKEDVTFKIHSDNVTNALIMDGEYGSFTFSQPITASNGLFATADIYAGNSKYAESGFLISGSSHAVAKIESKYLSTLHIIADNTNHTVEDYHPRLYMIQDGGLVSGSIEFKEGNSAQWGRNLISTSKNDSCSFTVR